MRRQEIIEAAADIFSKKGYHATSMQDIAEAVNLQKASLYHHFSSKQEILLAVLDQALDLLITNMQQVLELGIPSDKKLRQAMQVYIETTLNHRQLARVLLLEYRSLDPNLQSRHIIRRDRFEQMWRDLLLEGWESGDFQCQDISLTARGLLGVMNWMITWYHPDGPLPPATVAEYFSDLFLLGLLPRLAEQKPVITPHLEIEDA